MEDILFNQNKTTLTGINSRSPALWANCPYSWIKKYFPQNCLRWDAKDFTLIGTQTTEIAGPLPGTKVFSTTAGTVNPVSAINSVEKQGGAIKFNTDTDNDAAFLAQAYPSFRMSGLGGSTDAPLWFEACVAINTLLTNTLGFMLGMAETELWTLATAVPFNASDSITNGASFVGFRKGEDALGVVDTVVSDRATSFTNVGDDEGLITATYTFAKFGMLYFPKTAYRPAEYLPSRVIRFYQDNLELTTAISKTTLTGYTNLDANALGPIIGMIADSAGTTAEMYLKWLEVVQMPVGIVP